MFGWFKKVLAWIDGPSIKDTYEELLLQEAAEKQAAEAKKTTVEVKTVAAEPLILSDTMITTVNTQPEPVVTVSVNDQITDSVTATVVVTEAKPKRAKTAKGRFKADDKATPEVNEAWQGGKAPAKKPKKPAAPKKTKTK